MDRRRQDDRQRHESKCPRCHHCQPIHSGHGRSLAREIDEPLYPTFEGWLFVDRAERADCEPLPTSPQAGGHLHEHLRQLKTVALGQHDIVVADLLANLCQPAVEPMHRRAPPEDRSHGMLEEPHPEIAVDNVRRLMQQDGSELFAVERVCHARGQHDDGVDRPDHNRHRHRRRFKQPRRLCQADRPRRLA